MMIEINKNWCKGCAICVAMCPKNVLEIKDEKATVINEKDCIKCKQCEYHCPDFAIVVGEENE